MEAWAPSRPGRDAVQQRRHRSASCVAPKRHFGEDSDMTLRCSQDRCQSLLDKSAQLLSRSPQSHTSTKSSASIKSSICNSTSREVDTAWSSLDDLLEGLEDDSEAKQERRKSRKRLDAALPPTPPLPEFNQRIAWPERAACYQLSMSDSPSSGDPSISASVSAGAAPSCWSKAAEVPLQVDKNGVTRTLAEWAIQEMGRTTSDELRQEQVKSKEYVEKCEQLQEELSLRTQEMQSMQLQFAWWQKELSVAEEEQRRLSQECRDLETELAAARQQSAEQQQREDASCVVCLDSSATHVVVPCGHLALCEACNGHMTRCPVCRRPSSMVIKLFKP